MKRKFLIILLSFACVLACAFGFTACGKNGGKEHSHNWSSPWKSNETHHWHECTADGCTITNNSQKDGYGEHEFLGDGVCRICSYEKAPDSCKHSYIGKCDEIKHWEECEYCGDKINKEKHNFDESCHCNACGKYHSYDETTHTCIVCGKKDSSTPTEGLTYALNSDNESYYLKSIGTATDTDIVIATEYNGKPVTSIRDNAFNGCSSLTSITIPDSVTSIARYTFDGCNGLTSINYAGDIAGWCAISGLDYLMYYGTTSKTLYIDGKEITGELVIPNNITMIPSHAFDGCSSLTSITIPNSVTSIEQYAFRNCSGLTSITIPFVGASKDGTSNTHFGYIFGAYSLSNNSVYVPSSLKTVIITGGTNIGEGAFMNCSNLTSITIPDSVTNIGRSAFSGCRGLTSITIPNSATNIEQYAFRYCSGLTSITIPNSVTSIGSCTFENCSNLTGVTIGNGVTSIGKYAFSGCSSLESISLPFVGESKGGTRDTHFEYLFGEKNDVPSSLKTVIITGVTSIWDNAFMDCSNLTNITIGNSVTSIGYEAFYDCSSLTNITIGSGVTSIGNYAFRNCSNLTSISIGSGVTTIGSNAFENCDKLQYNEYDNAYYLGNDTNKYVSLIKAKDTSVTSCTINGNIRIIYDKAFYNCNALASIMIPDNVTTIGAYAFYGCSGLTSVTVPDGVTSIGTYAFYGCSGLTSFTVPDGVTSIGVDAFLGCNKLQYNKYDNAYYLGNDTNKYVLLIEAKDTSITSCTINENTKVIADNAFNSCNDLTSITIPNNVTAIGNYAFSCRNLTDISIGSGVTSIGAHAFSYCRGLTSITIPDNVTSIGDYAFDGCSNLTSITLGNGVTSIGNYAFRNCSSLMSITIGSGVTTIGAFAFTKCSSLTSITIESSVTTIGNYAFRDCNGLTSITIPDSVTEIGNYAFNYCSSLTSVIFNGTKAQWRAITGNFNHGYIVNCTDGKLDRYGSEIAE